MSDPVSIGDSVSEAGDATRRGNPAYARPVFWLAAAVVAAVIVVASTTVSSLVTLNSDVPTANAATSVTAPRTISESMYWVEGACVRFSADSADTIPCSWPERDGQVSAVVSGKHRCPWGDEFSVELDDGSVACISTP